MAKPRPRSEIIPRARQDEAGQDFDLLLRNLPLPIWICEARTLRILAVNRHASEQYGYSRREFLRMRVSDLRDEAGQGGRATLPRRGQIRLRRKDGSLVTAAIASGPCRYRGRAAMWFLAQELQPAPSLARPAEVQTLLDSLDEAIYIQDRAGRFLDVNAGAVRMYGYRREFFIGKMPADVAAPGRNDLERIMQAVRRAFEGEPQQFEFWGQRSNGEVFPKEVRLYKGTYRGEEVVIALAQDITERKRMEAALRASEERFRLLVENASETFYQVSWQNDPLRGEVIFVSPQAEAMTGHRAEEFLRDPELWVKSIHPDDLPRVLETTRTLLNERTPVTREYRLWNAARNDFCWVSDRITPRFDAYGRLIGYQGVARDITAHRQAEEALAASEAELRALFAALPDVVMVLDRDGRYLKIAPTHPEMLYRPAEELLGKRLHEIFSTPKADELLGYIREALEKQQSIHFEYALLIGGRVVWFAGATSPLTADTVVWVGRDITARKQAEEELQQRLSELSTLYEVAQRLQQILSPESLATEIIHVLEKALHYEHAAVFLVDASSGALVPFAASAGEKELGPGDLAGQVARSGQSLCLGNVASALWQDARSVLCVPLRFGNRLIGVAEVESTRLNAFGEADQRLLETISAQIAIAIQNARLYEETARRLTEVEALYQSSLSLGRSLERSTIGAEVVRVLSEHLRWHHAAVHLRRNESDEVELVAFSQGHLADTLPARQVLTRVGEGLPGWVIRHGRMVNSGNLRADPRYHETFPGMNSGLYAPIWAGGRVIGCISVESEQRQAFSAEDERLMIALASQAAIAFENARLYREAVRAAERRSILHTASQEIARLGQDLEQVYAAAHRAASRLMPSEAFVIALLDEARQEIDGVYLFDKGERSPRLRIPLGQGLSGRVIQSKTSLLIRDHRESDLPGVHFGSPEAVRSVLAVPMQVGERMIGMISVQSYRPDVYSEEDQLLLEMLAAQVAVAIENARLFEQTRRRMNELEALAQASQALTGDMPWPSLLERILQAAARAIPAAEQGAIFLREQPDGPLHIQAQSGPANTTLEASAALQEGAGRACREKRPLLMAEAGVQSLIAVPLLLGEEAIGAIALANLSRSQAFEARDLQLLNVFASSVTALIERTRLFDETRRRADEFQALYQIASEMSSQSDLNALLRMITEQARALSATAGSGLYLFDAERGELELVAITDPDIPTGLRLALGEGLSGQVAQTKEPLAINDYQAWEKRPALYEGFDFTSVLGVPLLYHGELIGVLTVHHRAAAEATRPRRGFRERDVHLLSLLANAAAGAVYSARLFARLKHRVDQLSAIHAVDMAIGATTDLRISLQIVLENITRLLEVDAAAAFLFNPATFTLQPVTARGFLTPSLVQTLLPAGKSLAGQAVLEKRPIYASGATAQTEFAQRHLAAEQFVAYVAVPLLAKGEVRGVLEIFQRTPLKMAQEWTSSLEMLAAQAALAMDNALLFENLDRTNTELLMAYDATIQGWSQALELRDRETQGHSQRVLDLTLRMAHAMGLSGKEIQNIRRGVLLHDIGKMGIPDSILHKKGALTEEEWEIMRQHPQYAYNMLAPIAYLREALDIPYCHHEKWDGSGYPRGLKGEAIPLSARLFTVADVYDALTSHRPYRPACTREQALEYIRAQAGKHFDPRVVEVFLKIIENG